MSFENFLTQCQKMYNIYEKEGEPMPDDAKTRFLFKRVQHSGLRGAIEALRAQITAGVAVSYTMAANHLSTAVSELPEYLHKNRNISGVESSHGIYNSDGTIITGHIPNWRNLSPEERNLVKQERRKSNKDRDTRNDADIKASANRIKQLQASNKKMKRKIKALKRSNKKGGESNDNGDSDTDMDAGDQFGGKASKRKMNEA